MCTKSTATKMSSSSTPTARKSAALKRLHSAMLETYIAPTSDNFIDRLASGEVRKSAGVIQQQRVKESLNAFDSAWKISSSENKRA